MLSFLTVGSKGKRAEKTELGEKHRERENAINQMEAKIQSFLSKSGTGRRSGIMTQM